MLGIRPLCGCVTVTPVQASQPLTGALRPLSSAWGHGPGGGDELCTGSALPRPCGRAVSRLRERHFSRQVWDLQEGVPTEIHFILSLPPTASTDALNGVGGFPQRRRDDASSFVSGPQRRWEGLDGVGGFPQRRWGVFDGLPNAVEPAPNGVDRCPQRRRGMPPTAFCTLQRR